MSKQNPKDPKVLQELLIWPMIEATKTAGERVTEDHLVNKAMDAWGGKEIDADPEDVRTELQKHPDIHNNGDGTYTFL